MFCDECGKNFQLDTEQCALTISTSRYICSDCTQELVKQLNKQEDKVMTRDKILEKAEKILEEKKRQRQKARKKYVYAETCFSAKICPKCGGHIEYIGSFDNPFSYFRCDNCGRLDYILNIYDY